MASDRAIQIVEHFGENKFKVKKEALKEIFGNERVSDLPLVVLCIAGAARKGKSFMLNFFLDYLILKEKSPSKPWILNEKTELNGFKFEDGEDRMTLGIWAWSHVFVIENGNGEKVAVSLIDSQGTFDSSTSYEDCSAIFAMTSMFSSVMCFNVFTDLQENTFNDFAAFVDHGKKIVENIGGSGKMFQNLVFIVRDFRHISYLNDENGGQKYVEKQLGDTKNPKLQKVRDNLNGSYERLFGFVFPYPGAKVAQEKTSKISEMEPLFVKKAKSMVETLLSQKNLQPKVLGSAKFSCKDMAKYIPLCVECFNDNPGFAPQDVHSMNRGFFIDLEVDRAIKDYESLMDGILQNCKTGFNNLFQHHETQSLIIKKEISDRIKDQNIRMEVIEKFMIKINSVYQKYCDKNATLLENERQRLEFIKRYEKQLARKNAENAAKLASQQREHQEQKDRERQEFQRRDAEAAAKREKERIEEAEKLRKAEEEKKESEKKVEEEKRKREEEKEKSDEEMAKMITRLSLAADNGRGNSPIIIHSPSPFQQQPYMGGGYGGGGMGDFFGGYSNGGNMGGYGGGGMGSSRGSSYGGGRASSSSSGNYGIRETIDKNGNSHWRDANGRFAKNPNKR